MKLIIVFVSILITGCGSKGTEFSSGDWLEARNQELRAYKEQQAKIYADFLFNGERYRMTCHHPSATYHESLCMLGPFKDMVKKGCRYLLMVTDSSIRRVETVCE